MPLDNPFQDPLRFERQLPECVVVIFGANGDLTKRKLLPALYRLAYERRLPPGIAVVGISRTAMSDEQFREKMRESVQQFIEDSDVDPAIWENFAQGLFYIAGDVGDPQCYRDLEERVRKIEAERHTGGNVLFYLSTQPSQYAPIAQRLGEAGLAKGDGWRRIVVEKPFGHDLASARELSDELHEVFDEYRGLPHRSLFGQRDRAEHSGVPLRQRHLRAAVEPPLRRITCRSRRAESIGVEGRGAYYQEAGALRDMIQNHLLQVMATVAMEPSAVFEPNAVRDERAKLLRSIRIMKPEEVRSQRGAGTVRPARIGGAGVPGVPAGTGRRSRVADRYLCRGDVLRRQLALGRRAVLHPHRQAAAQARDRDRDPVQRPPRMPFFDGRATATGSAPNLLILRIQPEEGISLRFLSKRPGAGMKLRPVSMDFNYGSSFGERSPSAYETLLLDAMIGDATLYTRQDMVEASWAVVEPIMQDWAQTQVRFPQLRGRHAGVRRQRTRCWRGAGTCGGGRDGDHDLSPTSILHELAESVGRDWRHSTGRRSGAACCAPAP